MEDVTKNLGAIINASSKSKSQIANELGVTNSVISDYISGRILPSLATFKKLCQVLDCNYEDILGRLE